MAISIRLARKSDHEAIGAVVAAAFDRADEAALVARLRADGDVVLELVAIEDDVVCGHILFSRLWADHHGLFAALAPLAVRPDLQRTGIGASLVKAGLYNVREFGAHGVLVLGDPDYYGRFGFAAAKAAGVTCPFRGNPAFQALAIAADAFDRPLTVAYPDAFGA